MSVLVADCPRCPAQNMTFDVRGQNFRGLESGWVSYWEIFSICRSCHQATVFVLRLGEYEAAEKFPVDSGAAFLKYDGVLNNLFEIRGHIALKDEQKVAPPEHLPDEIREVFEEGAACLAIGAVNAAATMFRLCVDLATFPLLPEVVEGQKAEPDLRARRDLGLRLPWLFDNKLLPGELRDLAVAIKDDGNDGAHRASLSEDDAEDILDFTVALLERLITEPKRLELAKERRAKRHDTA